MKTYNIRLPKTFVKKERTYKDAKLPTYKIISWAPKDRFPGGYCAMFLNPKYATIQNDTTHDHMCLVTIPDEYMVRDHNEPGKFKKQDNAIKLISCAKTKDKGFKPLLDEKGHWITETVSAKEFYNIYSHGLMEATKENNHDTKKVVPRTGIDLESKQDDQSGLEIGD